MASRSSSQGSPVREPVALEVDLRPVAGALQDRELASGRDRLQLGELGPRAGAQHEPVAGDDDEPRGLGASDARAARDLEGEVAAAAGADLVRIVGERAGGGRDLDLELLQQVPFAGIAELLRLAKAHRHRQPGELDQPLRRGRVRASQERLQHARPSAPGDMEARHRIAIAPGAMAAALGPAHHREPAHAHAM